MRLMVLLGLMVLAVGAAARELVVEALLPGTVVMLIDGARTTLRVGQMQKGVRLIEANGQSAVVEIDGRRQNVTVSQRISGQFTQPEKREVTVPRNDQMQYRTMAEINGVRLPVLIDTGANIVALNAAQARQAGIASDAGVPSQVQTAGSVVPARNVTLDTVDVGGIRVQGVTATVIDGPYPAVILLGMSYLQHVELQDQGGVLTLRARW